MLEILHNRIKNSSKFEMIQIMEVQNFSKEEVIIDFVLSARGKSLYNDINNMVFKSREELIVYLNEVI